MSPLEEGPSPGAVVLPSGESALDSGESVVPEGTEGSSVATASPIGSENSMGGGLCDLGLWLGEGRRGHHAAGERRRQAEAQKRPLSPLSHGGSPSLERLSGAKTARIYS